MGGNQMQTDPKNFVKKQRGNLPLKYARRYTRSTLRQLVRRQSITTASQLEQIETAYRRFIETPLR
jgi:hypothetical protein